MFNTTIVIILASFCMFMLPLLAIIFVKDTKKLRIITIVFLSLYLLVLLLGVWTRVQITKKVVNIYFDFSYGYFNKTINWGFKNLKISDICLNLIMFIPIGISYAVLSKRSYLRFIIMSILIAGSISIIIELGQYILPIRRAVQLSDVVFNIISFIIGVCVGKMYIKIRDKNKSNSWNDKYAMI